MHLVNISMQEYFLPHFSQ